MSRPGATGREVTPKFVPSATQDASFSPREGLGGLRGERGESEGGVTAHIIGVLQALVFATHNTKPGRQLSTMSGDTHSENHRENQPISY